MQVFLSWSGEHSHQVASALESWLGDVIQAVKPWISTKDIEKGDTWARSVSDALAKSEALGIFCLTPGNLGSVWMAYEAGVLTNQDRARVMTFLHGVSPNEVPFPLGLFQATIATMRDDVFKMIKTLNDRCPQPLPLGKLEKAFDTHWPELESNLLKISVVTTSDAVPTPDPKEVLVEIWAALRRLERNQAQLSTYGDAYANLGLGIINGARSNGAGLLAGALTQHYEAIGAKALGEGLEKYEGTPKGADL